MFGTHFYHEKTKKCVAIFGRLFNNIYVFYKGKKVMEVKVKERDTEASSE